MKEGETISKHVQGGDPKRRDGGVLGWVTYMSQDVILVLTGLALPVATHETVFHFGLWKHEHTLL